MAPVFLSFLVRVALVTAVLFAFPICLSAETLQSRETISHETGFYYTVKKGDTLWDISKKFFDTPWVWPDLWQKNDQLPNPHWIYPGEKLRLYLKDGKVQFEVVDEIPPSFHSVESAPPGEPPFYEYTLIDRVGFIRKTPAEPHGILFKSKDDKNMISVNDMVYVHPQESGNFQPGQRYIVYRTMPPTNDKDAYETIGYQHFFVGIVEIADKQPGLAVAKVIKSFRNIQINDQLIPYHPKAHKLYYKEGKPGLEGRVIGTEDHHKLIGHDMVGFIDKGISDGVTVGQTYELFYHEKSKTIKGQAPEALPAITFGSLLVLHIEQSTATVLITRSDRDIAPGVSFRASAM